MLCRLMQNKLFIIGAELEKDRRKGIEMRELNDTKRFTSQFLSVPTLSSNLLVNVFLQGVPKGD